MSNIRDTSDCCIEKAVHATFKLNSNTRNFSDINITIFEHNEMFFEIKVEFSRYMLNISGNSSFAHYILKAVTGEWRRL